MVFSEMLNKIRNEQGLSINKLGQLADVSPTYISRLQNNPDKKPTKKTFFKILFALFIPDENRSDEINEHQSTFLYILICSYLFGHEDDLTSEEKEEYKKFFQEFKSYVASRQDEGKQRISELQNNLYENKYILKKDGVIEMMNDKTALETNLLDKPIFDIHWFFSQKDFELLVPRKYIANNKNKNIAYNVLKEEDKKILSSIITAYMNSKFEIKKDEKDFFNKKFIDFISSVFNEDELIQNISKEISNEDEKK